MSSQNPLMLMSCSRRAVNERPTRNKTVNAATITTPIATVSSNRLNHPYAERDARPR
jgi:hypothetical protein